MKKLTAIFILFIFALTGCFSVPEGVSMDVDAPISVAVGETFDVTVTVSNQTEETQLMTSIDLGADFLDMVSINLSSPMYTKEWDMSYLSFFSYDYYLEIAAGESMDIVFNMTALEAGYASGDLDVCINTESDCMFGFVGTTITEARDAEAAE